MIRKDLQADVPRNHTVNSEQLNLFSDEVWRSTLAPWNGQSARVLTRAYKTFSLEALPAGGLQPNVRLSAQDKEVQAELRLDLPFKRR